MDWYGGASRTDPPLILCWSIQWSGHKAQAQGGVQKLIARVKLIAEAAFQRLVQRIFLQQSLSEHMPVRTSCKIPGSDEEPLGTGAGMQSS